MVKEVCDLPFEKSETTKGFEQTIGRRGIVQGQEDGKGFLRLGLWLWNGVVSDLMARGLGSLTRKADVGMRIDALNNVLEGNACIEEVRHGHSCVHSRKSGQRPIDHQYTNPYHFSTKISSVFDIHIAP